MLIMHTLNILTYTCSRQKTTHTRLCFGLMFLYSPASLPNGPTDIEQVIVNQTGYADMATIQQVGQPSDSNAPIPIAFTSNLPVNSRQNPMADTVYLVQNGSYNQAGIDQIGIRNHANVDQYGDNNIAAILQNNQNNQALAKQNGSLNNVTLMQSGSGNAAQLTQQGVGNLETVNQSGDGNSAQINQIGSGLSINITQTGHMAINITQH